MTANKKGIQIWIEMLNLLIMDIRGFDPIPIILDNMLVPAAAPPPAPPAASAPAAAPPETKVPFQLAYRLGK